MVVSNTKPSMTGYLEKRSRWLKDWRVRYFTLSGNQLYFAKAEGIEPHGSIDLRTCLTVKSADDKTGKPFAFLVATKEEEFFMCAKDLGERDMWISALGKAIVDSSRSKLTSKAFEADDDDDDDD